MGMKGKASGKGGMKKGGMFGMMGMMNMGKGKIMPCTGDWHCPACGDLQFRDNAQCKQCGTDKPEGNGTQAMMPGDWICPGCNDLVFEKNDACRMCQTPKPGEHGASKPKFPVKAGKAAGKMGKRERERLEFRRTRRSDT